MENQFKCSYCKHIIKESDIVCPHCKFPLKGTELEKSTFIGQQVLKKGTIKDAGAVRKTASYILLIIGVINTAISLLGFFVSAGDNVGFVMSLVVGLIFIILSRKAKQNSFYPLVIGLSLLLTIYIINGILDPNTIVNGIGGKMAYLGGLIYGIVMTYKERIIKKEHKNLETVS